MLSDRELLIAGLGGLIVLAALIAMAGLHEKHYRSRSALILAARESGSIDARLETIERILSEDRLT